MREQVRRRVPKRLGPLGGLFGFQGAYDQLAVVVHAHPPLAGGEQGLHRFQGRLQLLVQPVPPVGGDAGQLA